MKPTKNVIIKSKNLHHVKMLYHQYCIEDSNYKIYHDGDEFILYSDLSESNYSSYESKSEKRNRVIDSILS